MRLISVYAALHVLMMCCFIERSLSKMKPRLRTIPANSQSIFFREIACGCCKVVLTEDDDEKRIASVLSIIQFEFVFLHPQPNIFDTTLLWMDQAWVMLGRFRVIELCVVCKHFLPNSVHLICCCFDVNAVCWRFNDRHISLLWKDLKWKKEEKKGAVSYTHLTLPTNHRV